MFVQTVKSSSRHIARPLQYRTTRMASSNNNNPTENPSMLHGHAGYVSGVAKVISPSVLASPYYPDDTETMEQQEAIGTYVSSDPSWKTAGTETKDAAVAEMRAAKEQSQAEPGKNDTVGKMEEKLGGAVGCEGMVGEGKERQ